MAQLTRSALAAMIDHTLLKPEARATDIEILCREAVENGFATVCVQPYRVNLAANKVHGSEVKVCSVVGFPFGSQASAVKAMETVKAIADGANEIDMVLNIGALKDGNLGDVEGDIGAVIKAARGHLVKVILETCLLSDEEIVSACQISARVGANFVKTSTGFSKSGATIHHVKLMRATVGRDLGVKASGGIRDFDTLLKMIEAGATRIGTSSGVSLISGHTAESEY